MITLEEVLGDITEDAPDRSDLHAWVRLPSKWIEDRGLINFAWARGVGADQIAALMALAVITHHAHQETGAVRLTWSDLCDRTQLSRAKLGKGLDILTARSLILRGADGRSRFQLANFNPARDWAMLPAKPLYNRQGVVQAFKDFTLRSRAELDALKLYLLFAARRDRKSNFALLSYDKIYEYSGVNHNRICAAVSFLAAQNLVHINRQPSEINEYGTMSQYRLANLDSRRHDGTIGRRNLLNPCGKKLAWHALWPV